MLNDELRLRKEEFVSNLTGSSLHFVARVALVQIAAIHFLGSAALHIPPRETFKHTYQHILLFLFEFALIRFPCEFSYAYEGDVPDSPIWWDWQRIQEKMIGGLLFGSLVLSFAAKLRGPKLPYIAATRAGPQTITKSNSPFKKVWITNVKSGFMHATLVAILAVDFRMFPRKMAKTETYGTSMMDMGVGSVIVSSGLTSRLYSLPNPLMCLLKSIPVLIIGFAKPVVVALLNYPTHASEYGHHWNFFFTIALMDPMTSLLLRLFPSADAGVLGGLILMIYQSWLSFGGGEEWIMAPQPREESWGMLGLNREGVSSLFGYWALYLLGAKIGSLIRSKKDEKGSKKQNQGVGPIREELYTMLKIATITVVMTLLYFSSQTINPADLLKSIKVYTQHLPANFQVLINALPEPIPIPLRVSRRLCNLPYCLAAFVLACIFCGVTHAHTLLLTCLNLPIPSSWLMDSLNSNKLTVFLLGNALTGLVNLSMDTVGASVLVGEVVVSVYMIVLHVVGCLLDEWKAKKKLRNASKAGKDGKAE
ncbi:hypothetical protein HDV05_002211 [Chytridiales sp. JEL 0842]|nr:hypothetical protein HDV05_002211 [Chytridiales sp. JEL 0842]